MLHTQAHLEYKGNVKKKRFIFYEVILASLTTDIVIFCRLSPQEDSFKQCFTGSLEQETYIM